MHRLKRTTMKKVLAVAATAIALFAFQPTADAGSCGNCCPPRHSQKKCCKKRNKNIFAQMWELEQRKNAWLSRTFLGK